MMRELSLFSGAGGGLLGTKLLGWECIGYVEFNDYCQRIIKQRIEDGIFDEAPIFTDVREFIQSGAADEYRGFADVVTGGFPCQPFSVAGKRAGADDPRNMWPQTIEVIRRVRPKFCFLENVPGLLSAQVDDESGRPVYYYGEVLRDLAQSGYDAKWRVLSAAELGAPHKRDRLWIVANTNELTDGQQYQHETARHDDEGADIDLADTERERLQGSGEKRETEGQARLCGGNGQNEKQIISNSELRRGSVGRSKREKTSRKVRCADWWSTEPDVGRVAHGVPDRAHRIKALGNGQVPIVAAKIWELLA